jgi:DNA replication protein
MKQTDDLIRIAAAASGKGSRITFHGLQLRPTDELIRIAAAGKGCVEFAE